MACTRCHLHVLPAVGDRGVRRTPATRRLRRLRQDAGDFAQADGIQVLNLDEKGDRFSEPASPALLDAIRTKVQAVMADIRADH